MRRHGLGLAGLLLLGAAAVAAYVVWAVRAGARIGSGWEGLSSAWPYLLAGVLTVGVVIALFVRLAIWSQQRGYDDGVDRDQR